jgi:hypothetical protein
MLDSRGNQIRDRTNQSRDREGAGENRYTGESTQ